MAALAPANGKKLTKEVLAVLVHVRSVPEEIALVVDLVEDREALRIGFRLAVEGTLVVKNTVSTCRHKMCDRLASKSPLTRPIVP